MINSSAGIKFRFYTSSLLVEITGKKASDLEEFLNILKVIDESSVFYHVHHAFREYSFAPGQYSNDFVRWVAETLENSELAEKLAAVSVLDYIDLNSLRLELVRIIEEYLQKKPYARKAPEGQEFNFLKNIGIIVPTKYEVETLEEFTEALDNIGMRSLYYHFFDARLRLGRKTNDFSNWIRSNFGNERLAREIEMLDPYFMSLDQLKKRIIGLCGVSKPRHEAAGKILKFIRKIVKS